MRDLQCAGIDGDEIRFALELECARVLRGDDEQHQHNKKIVSNENPEHRLSVRV